MEPAALLQIVREPLKPGREAAFNAIEEERARIAATLGCPHPYLGAQSLAAPIEAWWFNGYRSPTERRQVYDAYAKNTRLMTAWQESAKAKTDVTLKPIEVFARYRPDLSAGAPWLLGHGRALVITTTNRADRLPRTVFDGTDGTRFIVTSADALPDAEAARVSAPGAIILAIRPAWSFPAADWIAADPAFWRP